MARLTRPTPHRLIVALSLLLAIAVALPESTSARHKKPKRASGTPEFTASFTPPPAEFRCTWEEIPHDYMCSPSPTGWPNPFALRFALSRNTDDMPQPLPGQVWRGLANPAFAPTFSCRHNGSQDFSAANYNCTYRNPRQEHRFTAAQIVAICDDERVSPQGDSYCSERYKPDFTGGEEGLALVFTPLEFYVFVPDPPVVPPPSPPPPRELGEGPGDGYFELDRWYPPDTMPPDTSITAGPSGMAGPEAQLDFTSSEDGSSFECRLDGSNWEECEPPQEYTELNEGAHAFEVRATDDAANLDLTAAARSWQVDATAPDTVILRGPPKFTRDRTPRFAFIANELFASYECKLDSGAFTTCPSPHTVRPRLRDGKHTFRVAAADGVGNVDDSPAIRSFTVDRTGPRIQIPAGRVQLNRKGRARLRLGCPRAELSGLCVGTLVLKARPPLEIGGGRRIATLAKKGFRLRRGTTGVVVLKLLREARRPVLQRQRVRVRVTARARDRLGNVASTSRSLLLEP